MRRVFWALVALTATAAQAEPWLCTLPDGSKEFSYEPEAARNRNCVAVPISRGYVRRAPARHPDAYASEAEFPRVDAKTQKRRDTARREILERELEEERRSLADATTRL